MSHLPQPARARGRAMATIVRRAKRAVVVIKKTVRAKRTTLAADLAASEALEAAPEMLASDAGGEN